MFIKFVYIPLYIALKNNPVYGFPNVFLNPNDRCSTIHFDNEFRLLMMLNQFFKKIKKGTNKTSFTLGFYLL